MQSAPASQQSPADMHTLPIPEHAPAHRPASQNHEQHWVQSAQVAPEPLQRVHVPRSQYVPPGLAPSQHWESSPHEAPSPPQSGTHRPVAALQ